MRPSPPEHPEQNLENRKGKEHVWGIQKMLDKKRHRGDGENGEYQAWDEGQEKQKNRCPKRDLGLTLVRLFKDNGFAIWWFDGDRNAARESFVRRGTEDRSLEAFTAQMQSIENGWLPIKDVIGDNIINTVSAGPTHAAPEDIYRRMFAR